MNHYLKALPEFLAKNYTFIVVAIMELVIVAAFVWFADFSNRIHPQSFYFFDSYED